MKYDKDEEENSTINTIAAEKTFKMQGKSNTNSNILTIKSMSQDSDDTKSSDDSLKGCDYKQPQPNCSNPELLIYLKTDTISKLKESTRKLIRIINEIQAKTRKKSAIVDGSTQSAVTEKEENNSYRFPCEDLTKLEYQTKLLQTICIEQEDDDCSIYKRLTRKCSCLNNNIFNDFVMQFNENSKYTTNNFGEIVKNLRILKKFLYIGGDYTKNALLFLNQGLSQSKYTEKVEITQGCAHADICNIFEEHSIVTACISWPFKVAYFGDETSQLWTAEFLNQLAGLEEGRRYLTYNSKILNDIRKLLRKKNTHLKMNIVDALSSTLLLLTPPFMKNAEIKYFCKSAHEGIGNRTVKDLVEHRQYMTQEEIIMHLELLKNFSRLDFGKEELSTILQVILILFKGLIMEYNNSEINILITNILNSIISKQFEKNEKVIYKDSKADIGTEAIELKNEKKSHKKKHKVNNKKGMGVSPTKKLNYSKQSVSGWEPLLTNNSKKNHKDLRSSVIFVPIEY